MKYILILIVFLTVLCAEEKIFISCEGNFYDENTASLWIIADHEITEYNQNTIGHIAQSLLVHNDQLFIALNGSSQLQVYDIDKNGITLNCEINTENSGPREMLILNDKMYFTNWYTADVKKLN